MSIMIKNMQFMERPRERLINYGASSLSNSELLAIILKTGTKNLSVIELASNIINKVDGFSNLKYLTKETLMKEKGIGKVKAIELLATIEFGKRLFLYNEKTISKKYKVAKDIFLDNKYLFIDKKQEYLYCLYLNPKKELIERRLLFMGTVNKSVVHPREIFKEAYLLSASGIVVMHNHPSGDPTPSYEDIMLTNSLIEIGKLQQIPIIDHIIFGNDRYYSFYEENKI